MKFVGRVYAKIGSRYIECTETIEDLENKITELETQVKNLTMHHVVQQRELLIAFCEFAEQVENHDLNSHGLITKWLDKSN